MRFRPRSPSMWPTFLKVLELAGLPSPPLEIYVKLNHAYSHRASAIAIRRSSSRPSAIIVETQSARMSIITITAPSSPQRTAPAKHDAGIQHPGAHTTILRPPAGSQSAATLPLKKDPGVTDRAPLNARFSGTPVVHRRCGLRRWDQRDSTAQHRRRLHQAESLDLFGWPLE
jgi:hypothetical protein